MKIKNSLTSLFLATSLAGFNPDTSKSQEFLIYPAPICQPAVTIINPPVCVVPAYVIPTYVAPIVICPPVIINPAPIYIIPQQVPQEVQVIPRESPKEHIYNTEDIVSKEHGQDLFVKYSNHRVFEKIGEIPSSSYRIGFVKNKLERIANPQVDELPSKGWNETWINGNRAWVQVPRKTRDYSLHSVICDKESYDVYAETPDRSSDTGRNWKHIGKINPGGDRLIFSDNNSVTCY